MWGPAKAKLTSNEFLTGALLFLSTLVIVETVLFGLHVASSGRSYARVQSPREELRAVSPPYPRVPPYNISSHVAVREYGFRSVLPLHYINLDRSIYRKNYIEDVFKNKNSQIKRVPAIDKKVVDEYVEGGKSFPGEKCLVASHFKALMTGFHLNTSMIADISSNSSDAIPKLSKKIKRKGDYDNIVIFEDDSSSFPGMLYSSPWAIERLARTLDENEKKWRVGQMQLAFIQHFTWDILTQEIETFKGARNLRNMEGNIFLADDGSEAELPHERKSEIFRTRYHQLAWGAVANMYSRNVLNVLSWLNKTSHRWNCHHRKCIYDEVFPDALWSTPPLFTYKMGEGATGVRKVNKGRNDQAQYHLVTVQITQHWAGMLHDAKATPHVISVKETSPVQSVPTTWSRYRKCEHGL